ncbi:MAG TPA: SGNH/GDSL hydrolase family protein [Chloroflexota bacterium]|nr:SGNH/GDSL hydrolase family protein [Chloroflexota bacterium]
MSDALMIDPNDSRLSWPGAISLQRSAEGWVMPWRVPFEQRSLFAAPLVDGPAMAGAGVRLAFRSDTSSIRGQIVPQPGAGRLDLCCDGAFVTSVELADQEQFCFDGLPGGEKQIELWLPQGSPFRLRGLRLDAGASLQAVEDTRPRWIVYGSSITQCGAAERPTQTWPAIVARGHGLNLTCLGYGGQCHLDSMIARMMRDRPAEYLSMCVGINIYGGGSLGPRAFGQAIIGSVLIVREKHPATPLAVMSPIYSPPRETTQNAVGFTLQAMREEVAAAVEAVRAHGDANTHYVDGLCIFGPEAADKLPDQLHPDAEGYQLMGRNYLHQVAQTLFV